MPRKVLSAATQAPRADGAIQVEVTLPVRARCGDTRARRCPDASTHSPARIPRISRLMALAIKFQEMVDRGEVRDYADLARLGYVTRARITQIMNLLNLAPDIQEELLDLAGAGENRALAERQIRSITKIVPSSKPTWATCWRAAIGVMLIPIRSWGALSPSAWTLAYRCFSAPTGRSPAGSSKATCCGRRIGGLDGSNRRSFSGGEYLRRGAGGVPRRRQLLSGAASDRRWEVRPLCREGVCPGKRSCVAPRPMGGPSY